MAESKFVELGDVRLHYAEAPGPGPVLLLLHGFTDSLESYQPLIPRLSTLTHVYAVDLRGHGESSHTPNNYTLRVHVDDIKRFIDTLIGAPVVILGHSMGADVAAWFTGLHPELVHALIIEDNGFDYPPDSKNPNLKERRDLLEKLQAPGTTMEEAVAIFSTHPFGGKTRLEIFGPDGVQRHTRQQIQMDVTHFDSIIEGTGATGWDGKEILSHITCPTLLITSNQWTGDEGVQQLQFYKDNVKHGQHIVIDVDNHRVHELRPNEYLDAVVDFLKPLISE